MDKSQINTVEQWLGSGSINIFGRPFAGKDTQGEIIAEALGGVLVAGGDILRHYHDQDKIKELMSSGRLFPTDFYLQIVLPFLSQAKLEGKPLILSSVGRLHGEEDTIVQAAQESGHPIKAAIYLELTEDQVWQRFEESKITRDRGDRADDREDALKTRLEEFQEKTVPVIDYYQDKGLLIKIDGTLSREEVTNQIISLLAQKAQS